MAANLLDMTRSAMGKRVMEQLEGLLGFEDGKTAAALDVALPALLGGMMKKASTTEGAIELFGLLDKYDGSLLDNLGGMLTGGKESMLIDMGRKILATVFGGNLSSILATVGKLLQIDAARAGSILAMLAPIVLSVLGKQKKAGGWNVSQFAQVLMAQKENLPALDPKLTSALGIASLAGGNRKAVSAVADRSPKAKAVREAATAGSSFSRWLIVILALAAAGFLLWKFVLNKPAAEPANADEAGRNEAALVAEVRSAPAPVQNRP